MNGELSATVLMRPAAGGCVAEAALAETAEQVLPDPAAVAAAQALLRKIGFEVTAAYGPSFSIVGPRALFEHTFGQPIVEDERGGVRTAGGTLELPLDALPADVAGSIQAVTFTPPPDFGPTEFR